MNIVLLILFGLVLLAAVVWAVSALVSVVGGVQLVTTPRALFSLIAELAALEAGQTFVEVGSGLGLVSGYIANNTQARVIGIDLSPLWVVMSRIMVQNKRATFRVGNVFTADLSETDVVYCYLLPPMLRRLEPSLARRLKPGTRVISYCFPIQNRTTTRTIARTDNHGPLFLYQY